MGARGRQRDRWRPKDQDLRCRTFALVAVLEQLEQGVQCPQLEHDVTTLRAVARDVAERPDRLLLDVVLRRGQQLDEDRDRT